MSTLSRAMAAGALVLAMSLPCWGDDPLAPYRERFQSGLDRFRAGEVAAAVEYWEPIRKELGDAVAYRLLYNLGKAYEALGDATKAAERYEGFLQVADAQFNTGSIEPTVAEQRLEARQQLQQLQQTRGRIRVIASERPGMVQIDLGEASMTVRTVYVAPGKHTVTIDPSTKLERKLEIAVAAGEEVVVDGTRPLPLPASSASASAPVTPSPSTVAVVEYQHPFPATVLMVSGGVTILSTLFPLLTYRHAKELANEYQSPSTTLDRRAELYGDYDSARTLYRWSWAAPVSLALLTGGLTYWYLHDTKTRVVAQPVVGSGGVSLSVGGNF